MKTLFAALAVSAAFLATSAYAAGGPPYAENGPVWDFAQIKTKDGHFDEYMKWLDTAWKQQEETLKKAGYIMDYKVYVVTDPRSGEPDLLLATEYKNMAAMDTPVAEMYAFAAKHFGSADQADKEQSARGSIRTVMGDMLIREAVLR